jgi:hypothetical protein
MTMETTIAQLKADSPWLSDAMISVIQKAFVKHGDDQTLLLNEVRVGDGKAEYDKLFPNNRRDGGTFRLSENKYLSNKFQYENTLRMRGLDPASFQLKLAGLFANDVAPNEFESRVAAINESIATRTDGFRQAFAQASGLDDFSAEGVLAVALDPDGVGRELLERRISLAQIRGSALDSGYGRSQARAVELFEQGVTGEQTVAFDASVGSTMKRLGTISNAYLGTQGPQLQQLEQASLEKDQRLEEKFTRMLQRERAGFSSSRGVVNAGQTGAVTGLAPTQARG